MINKIISYKQYMTKDNQIIKPHLINEIKEILLYIRLFSDEEIFNKFSSKLDPEILVYYGIEININYISFDSSLIEWYKYLLCSSYFADKQDIYFINLEEQKHTEKTMKIIKMLRISDITAYHLNEIFLNGSFVINQIETAFKNENITPDIIKEKSINEKYLKDEYYNNDFKNIIVKSCTGTGKTTSVLNYITKSNMKIIFISSRVSLAQDVSKKMNEMKIRHKIYNNLQGHPIFCGENFIIQYDSLKTVDDVIDQIYEEYQQDKKSEYVLFLDEINNLLNYLCSSTTLKNKRCRTYDLFLKLVESCKVIASDNSITNITYDFFNNFDNTPKYIYNTYQSWKNTKVRVFQDENKFKLLISEKMNNTKINIISDSKKIVDIYKKELDINNNWTVQTSDTEYLDCDKWQDVTIYSPKICVGVDDSQYAKELFLIVSGRSVDSMDLFQMITRCRSIIKLNIIFIQKEHIFNDSKYKSLECVDDELKKANCAYNSLLLEYNIDPFNDGKINFKKSFYRIFRQHLYIKDLYFTSISRHLIKILEDEGFNIEYDECLSSDKKIVDNLETMTALKKFKLDNFNINHDKYAKINKILKIPDSEIDNYIDIFIKEHKLNEHFTISNLFFNDLTLDKKLKRNVEETEYIKLTQSTSKIIIINKIGKLLNINSVLDIQDYKEKYKKIVIPENLITMYKGTFQRSRKIETCKTSADLMNIYGSLIHSNCGNILLKQRVRNKDKLTYKYTLNKDILTKHKILVNFRNINNDNFKDVFQDKDYNDDVFID